jgi:hypothetical protein
MIWYKDTLCTYLPLYFIAQWFLNHWPINPEPLVNEFQKLANKKREPKIDSLFS